MSKKVQIVLGPTAMEITPEPVANNVKELFPIDQIIGVFPVAFNKKPVGGTIKFSAASGAFTLGETITGGTSTATATIAEFLGTNQFRLSDIVGTFVAAEIITGGTSTTTATTDTAVIANVPSNEWIYPHPTMTIITLELENEKKFDIELQDVTNQATWNLGTLAALQQAVADIRAWL